MKRIFGLAVLLGVSSLFGQEVFGQEAPRVAVAAPGEKPVTKVVTLKNKGYLDLRVLDGIGLTVKRAGDLVVVTGPPDRVDIAESILKQLDVPPPPQPPPSPRRSVQLTAYLIVASGNEIQGTPVPKDLESPVHEVASVFPYKSFNLLDAIDVRLRNGSGGELTGVLPPLSQTPPRGGTEGGSYSLSVKQVQLMDGDATDLMRIDKFNLTLAMRGNQKVTLETDIDMKPGQKIVVGKANIDGGSDALIVILTAKVVD
jgi:hypothetical protein